MLPSVSRRFLPIQSIVTLSSLEGKTIFGGAGKTLRHSPVGHFVGSFEPFLHRSSSPRSSPGSTLDRNRLIT